MLFNKVLQRFLITEGEGHLTGKSFDSRGLPKNSAGFADNSHKFYSKDHWSYKSKPHKLKDKKAVLGATRSKETQEVLNNVFKVLQDVSMLPEKKKEIEEIFDSYAAAYRTKTSLINQIQTLIKTKETIEKQIASISSKWMDMNSLTTEEITHAAFIFTNDVDEKFEEAIYITNKILQLNKEFRPFKEIYKEGGKINKGSLDNYLNMPEKDRNDLDVAQTRAQILSMLSMRFIALQRATFGGEKKKVIINGIDPVSRNQKGKALETPIQVAGTVELFEKLKETQVLTSMSEQLELVDMFIDYVDENVSNSNSVSDYVESLNKVKQLIKQQQENSLFSPERSDIVMRLLGMFRAAANRGQRVKSGDFKRYKTHSKAIKLYIDGLIKVVKLGSGGTFIKKDEKGNITAKMPAAKRFDALLDYLRNKTDENGKRVFPHDDIINDLQILAVKYFKRKSITERLFVDQIRTMFEYIN